MAKPPSKNEKDQIRSDYPKSKDADNNIPAKEKPTITGHGWEIPVELLPVILGGVLFYLLQMQFYPQSVEYYGKGGFIAHVTICVAIAIYIVWIANKQIRK